MLAAAGLAAWVVAARVAVMSYVPWVWAALLFGIGYHVLTPKGAIDRVGYAIFRRLPGPVIGVLLAALALAVHLLLASGPRANIYFQF